MLESIDEFLRSHEHRSDRRVLLQLDQVRAAIRQVINGIQASEAGPHEQCRSTEAGPHRSRKIRSWMEAPIRGCSTHRSGNVSCLKDRAFQPDESTCLLQAPPLLLLTLAYGLLQSRQELVDSLDRRSPGNMGLRLDCARILWELILTRRGGDPAAFRWPALSEEDLRQAELLMPAHWAQSTTYKRMMRLLVFTRFLASRNLCRPLYYTAQTPRVEDFNRHTIAGEEARRDRLPSEAVLNGLADVYREHGVEPRDRLRLPRLPFWSSLASASASYSLCPWIAKFAKRAADNRDTASVTTERRAEAVQDCLRFGG